MRNIKPYRLDRLSYGLSFDPSFVDFDYKKYSICYFPYDQHPVSSLLSILFAVCQKLDIT